MTVLPSIGSAAVLPQAQPGLQIPINFTSADGAFTGVFTLSQFVTRNGQIAAVGTLTGTVTNATGQTVGAVARNLTLSVINISAPATFCIWN